MSLLQEATLSPEQQSGSAARTDPEVTEAAFKRRMSISSPDKVLLKGGDPDGKTEWSGSTDALEVAEKIGAALEQRERLNRIIEVGVRRQSAAAAGQGDAVSVDAHSSADSPIREC